MPAPEEIRTERLLLRQWQEEDREPLASMNADPEVMAGYPSTLTREESDAWFDRARRYQDERGFGIYAVEVPEVSPFAGFAGLSIARAADLAGRIEIAYRFARHAWGNGYADEACRAVLRMAFEDLRLDEVLTYTATTNVAGRRSLERLGMAAEDEDRAHPGRVVYRAVSASAPRS